MSEKEKSENNANPSVFHTNSRRQVLTGIAVGAAALATNRSIHATRLKITCIGTR